MSVCPLWHLPAKVTPLGTKETRAFLPQMEEVGGEVDSEKAMVIFFFPNSAQFYH